MKYWKLTKEQFDMLAEDVGWKDQRCCECGELITRDNFGVLEKNYMSCNNIICQIAVIDKLGESD